MFVLGQYKATARNAIAIMISKIRRATRFVLRVRRVLLDSWSVISEAPGRAIVLDVTSRLHQFMNTFMNTLEDRK